jgi:hypothetical protein
MFEEDVSGIVLFEVMVWIIQRWLKRMVVVLCDMVEADGCGDV